MIKYGLTAVALNRDTIEEAQRTPQEESIINSAGVSNMFPFLFGGEHKPGDSTPVASTVGSVFSSCLRLDVEHCNTCVSDRGEAYCKPRPVIVGVV